MTTTGTLFADGPTASGEITVAAPPQRLWPLISDPVLLAGISTELQQVEWLDGASAAALGARFRGHNANPDIGEWSTTCTVIACDEDREFGWAVEDLAAPIATWRFVLEPADDGTVLRQSVRMGRGPSGITMAIERWPDKEERIVARRLRQWQDAITANLAEFKARAEAA